MSASSLVVVPAGYHHHRRRPAGPLAQARPRSGRWSGQGSWRSLRTRWDYPPCAIDRLGRHPRYALTRLPGSTCQDTRAHRSLSQLVRPTGDPGRSIVGAWFPSQRLDGPGPTGCLDEQHRHERTEPPPSLASSSVSNDRSDRIPLAPHLVDEARYPRLQTPSSQAACRRGLQDFTILTLHPTFRPAPAAQTTPRSLAPGGDRA